VKKWHILLISVLSALVILLSAALFQVLRIKDREEDAALYPVKKLDLRYSDLCWSDFTLEDAVTNAALIAICEVSEILPTIPSIRTDPETGEELSRGARTPAVLQIETVLKGDPDRKTVTFQMLEGSFIEKNQDGWFVYQYEASGYPVVEKGDRVLIFFTEDDEPVGPLVLHIDSDQMTGSYYLRLNEEDQRFMKLEYLTENIRAIAAASE